MTTQHPPVTNAPEWHRVLVWCLPALAIGLVLRVLLAWGLPFAYMQHDSFKLLFGDAGFWEEDPGLASNTTFLVPWLDDLAARSGLPGLVAIELGQHLLGLAAIFAIGGLVWLTFHQGRWFIVPGTLIAAAHPALLWYEHTVMAEPVYLFSVIMLAFAGAVFVRFRNWPGCIALCAALYLTAIARPEGWMFLGFGGLVIVLTADFSKWRRTIGFVALFAATAVAARVSSATHESGLLLYSSILHLSPETSRRVPETAPFVRELRADAIAAARIGPAFVSREQRRSLAASFEKFVGEHPQPGGGSATEQADRVARTLALETCLHAWWRLPALALQKFRASASEPPAGEFSEAWLIERQWRRLRNGWEWMSRNAHQLYGRPFATLEEYGEFIRSNYRASQVRWFESWSGVWNSIYEPKLRATRFPNHKLEGLPFIYLLALAGMIATLAAGRLRSFHLAWITMLLGLWFVIMVTANERARFRLVFEPFIFLYLLALADVVLMAVRRRCGVAGRAPSGD